MTLTRGIAALSLFALAGLVVPLGGGAGCSSEECTELSCSELSGDSSNGRVFTMCEDAGEGYVRLDRRRSLRVLLRHQLHARRREADLHRRGGLSKRGKRLRIIW